MANKIIDPKKLRYVSEDDVPKRRQKTPWEFIFKSIPQGQAVILESKQVSPSSVRLALKRFKKLGKFKNLRMTTRKIPNTRRDYEIYIVNPTDDKKE